ncbi:hypothetical protein ACN28I_31730 [Archangium gephyra]|uniref:hypothetical protein n=1 Tax=Archangium gephyra TaxID=48 RepID=UPI003B7E9D26
MRSSPCERALPSLGVGGRPLLVEAQKAVEQLLMLLRERHPPHECWRKLTEDRESNALLFEVDYNLGFKTPLPRSLAQEDSER